MRFWLSDALVCIYMLVSLIEIWFCFDWICMSDLDLSLSFVSSLPSRPLFLLFVNPLNFLFVIENSSGGSVVAFSEDNDKGLDVPGIEGVRWDRGVGLSLELGCSRIINVLEN